MPAMKKNKPVTQPRISKGKRLIFSLIAVLLPFVFLILLELVLRISGYGDNMALFINHPDKEFEDYKVVNPEIGKKYFYKLEYSAPAKDAFLKKKPEDIFRVFVLGSSTVVGFPYENNLMFPRILQERLRDAYPDKKIEMVNTAITAINSFTLADFMPQILEEKPDAILIYAGHNEFYGAFGAGSNEAMFHSPALIRTHLRLMNYRVYQLVVNMVSGVTGIFKSGNDALQKRGTLMTRMVKDADIAYGSKTYREGMANYEENLGRMLDAAKAKNVPVFIGDLVSNLRDMKPFKSIAAEGIKGADEYFRAARDFEKQGNMEKAKENYVLARDYDGIRFRASSDINNIVRKLADRYQCHFVPAVELFNASSPGGIVGDNLLTEHVHPNASGEFLLAEAFYKELVNSKLIAPKKNELTEKSYRQFVKDYGYSNLDLLIGYHRIMNLKYHWPFKDESNGFVDYREVYRPKGIVDSLAFNVMAKHEISLADAHEFLAERYKKRGDFYNAFKEYNALTKILPYWSPNFRAAGDCLLKMSDLPRALHFYERSTEYNQGTFYAHFRAGEICLMKNDLESALLHFQKSQTTATADEKQKALYKIYQVLTYLNRQEEAKDIVDYFRKTNQLQLLQVPLQTGTLMNYIPSTVSAAVDEAKAALNKKDLNEAIRLLQASLDTQETSIAFRMMGGIYLKKGEFEKASQLLMNAYNDFQFDGQFLNHLVLADVGAGKIDQAKAALEQLKKVAPSLADISALAASVNGRQAPNASEIELNF